MVIGPRTCIIYDASDPNAPVIRCDVQENDATGAEAARTAAIAAYGILNDGAEPPDGLIKEYVLGVGGALTASAAN